MRVVEFRVRCYSYNNFGHVQFRLDKRYLHCHEPSFPPHFALQSHWKCLSYHSLENWYFPKFQLPLDHWIYGRKGVFTKSNFIILYPRFEREFFLACHHVRWIWIPFRQRTSFYHWFRFNIHPWATRPPRNPFQTLNVYLVYLPKFGCFFMVHARIGIYIECLGMDPGYLPLVQVKTKLAGL